jgi:hypothetical protein
VKDNYEKRLKRILKSDEAIILNGVQINSLKSIYAELCLARLKKIPYKILTTDKQIISDAFYICFPREAE